MLQRSPSSRLLRWVYLLLVVLCIGKPALAQHAEAPHPIPQIPSVAGMLPGYELNLYENSGTVNAVVSHGGAVYMGGGFTHIDGTEANNIAMWDGTAWRALSSGIQGGVRTMVSYQGDLYVGGSFTRAGEVEANNIARWDGSEWHALGEGVIGSRAQVLALTVFEGALFVGGEFEQAGGAPALHLARWDGTRWGGAMPAPMHVPFQNPQRETTPIPFTVTSLIVFKENLYLSSSTDIRRWNGSSWVELDGGLRNRGRFPDFPFLYAHSVVGDYLYVGGLFNTAIGSDLAVRNIARWDGTNWTALGSGMQHIVRAITAVDSTIYVGSERLDRWDGSVWSEVSRDLPVSLVNALAVQEGSLYVGGAFMEQGISTPFARVERWDGSSWHTLNSGGGFNGVLRRSTLYRALQVFEDALVVAGDFDVVGTRIAPSISSCDEHGCIPMGDGVPGTIEGEPGRVQALGASGSDLYVGGAFTALPNMSHSIARWDGSRWLSMGYGTTHPVAALSVSGTDVYVGGKFYSIGGGARNIGRWNGTEWIAMGASNTFTALDKGVEAVAVVQGDVYIGGQFTSVYGNTPANCILRWDGTQWTSVRDGLTRQQGSTNACSVKSMVGGRGNLYVSGLFDQAGSTAANRIALWDGFEWRSLGLGLDNQANAMVFYKGNLYVGGDFTTAGGKVVRGVARWDGMEWFPLGEGIQGSVYGMEVYRGALYVVGNFTAAGGRPASGFARWNGVSWSNRLDVSEAFLPGEPESEEPDPTLPAALPVSWRPNGPVLASAYHNNLLYVGGAFSHLEAVTGGAVLYGALHPGAGSVQAAPFSEGPELHFHAGLSVGDSLLLGGSAGLRLLNASNEILALAPIVLPGTVQALLATPSHIVVGGEGFVCRIPRGQLVSGISNRCEMLATLNGTVNALYRSGAHVYVGGRFTTLESGGMRLEVSHLARLLDTGWDTTWSPALNGEVHVLAGYENRLVVGGAFSAVGATVRNRLLAYDLTTGALLPWNPNVNGPVFTLGVDALYVYAGGRFSAVGGAGRTSVARFSRTTHELDAWSVTLTGSDEVGGEPLVRSLLPHASHLLVGGTFSQVDGEVRRNLVAFPRSHTGIRPWAPNPDGEVSVLVSHGAQVLVAGRFTTGMEIAQPHLAALRFLGRSGFTVEEPFSPSVQGTVRALSYCNGRLFVGGDFVLVQASTHERLAELHATTGQVSAWNAGADAPVHTLACSGETLFVGGSFTRINGNGRNHVASFSVSGAPALAAWAPTVNGAVHALAVKQETVYMGGAFSQVGGVPRVHLASVNASAGVVSHWNPAVNGPVRALATDDQHVYAGGAFTQVGSQVRNHLAQIDLVGLATGWAPEVNGPVEAVLYDDGVLYAGGTFSSGAMAFATRGVLRGSLDGPRMTVQTMALAGENVVFGGMTAPFLSRREALEDDGPVPPPRITLNVREGNHAFTLTVEQSTTTVLGPALPPVPADGTFDVRFRATPTVDTRFWASDTTRYPIRIQRSNSSTPVLIGFTLPEDTYGILRQGSEVIAALHANQVMELSVPGTVWQLELELQGSSRHVAHDYGTLPVGGNRYVMVSFPFEPEGRSAQQMFGPSVFVSPGTGASPLLPLRGYWMNITSDTPPEAPLSGPFPIQEISVQPGWNLIGGFSEPVALWNLTMVPRSLIAGAVFTYSRTEGSYVPVTELLPGHGYYLRATAAGVIWPGAGSFSPAVRTEAPNVTPFLRVSDGAGRSAALYIAQDEGARQHYVLPPYPVGSSSFDVRLGDEQEDSRFERWGLATTTDRGSVRLIVHKPSQHILIERMSGAPVVDVVSSSGATLGTLVDRPLRLEVNGQYNEFLLRFKEVGAEGEQSVYPQPANDEVRVQFSLPEAGSATVTVFNLIGQEVMRVELGEREAGFIQEILRVDALPTGIYILRIDTEQESYTRSLVIAR